MATYGKTIQSLRTGKGMTQTELGNALNVTYQAVSKWENDLSQPDLGTISAMCKLFEITLDQFIAISEGKEVAPSSADGDDVNEATVEAINTSTAEIVRAELERQRKEEAEEKRQAALAAQKVLEEKKRKEAAAKAMLERQERHHESVVFRWGFWIGAVLGVGLAIAGIFLEYPLYGLLLGYMVWALGAHMNHDDWWAYEVFVGGWDWSWRAPGLIFSFDIDGCLWVIVMKWIVFPIISIILSLVVGLGGTLLALVLAGIGMPFKFAKILRCLKEGDID